MRWEDERYVRLYTRDTVDWEMLPWQSRALLPLLLRKVDRAGILQLGKHGTAGLAHVVGMPTDVTDTGLTGLLEDGSVELHENTIVVRNFIEAQETTASDAKRAREYRERNRNSVTRRDEASPSVTDRHAVSRDVTDRHSVPFRSVPSRTVPRDCADPSAPLALSSPSPAKKKGSALPYSVAVLTKTLADSSAGRFVDSPLGKGPAIAAQALIRAHSLDDVRLAGAWLGAGGDEWRGSLDVRALRDLPVWVGHAREWDKNGRGDVGGRGGVRRAPRKDFDDLYPEFKAADLGEPLEPLTRLGGDHGK